MQIITDPAGKELKKHGDSSFPFLVSYERLSGYETGSFLWHWHPEIELTYIEKGEMLYKINQNTFHLKEGQAIFGNANALHAGYMYQDQDCQYIPITFDPKLIYGFREAFFSRNIQNRSSEAFPCPPYRLIYPVNGIPRP